ncbi:Rqc2 family fibronectin-binding protein [Inconstantimicrobium mannanitabidum]|uniref:Uncharacterized protein n=1 Tax=Inconstantimicrobium mannanitabidum TaxID=1604901 RepID=A0ACB5RAJ3_9CLOT|nr:NFACT family protein [Clostridium sp. TW13]GKX66132.1 hypothetical protein rsdtw13_13900 [Clostridium sp. TW13]
MAFDGIFLHKIINTLNNELIGKKIDKVNQPEKDEIHLSIRNMKKVKLLISASSSYPRMHLTKQTKPNPIQAPMFCMVLRKYLLGAKIVNIKQYNTDRFLSIDFEVTDELGFNSIYTLYIEIMGRHSNISLVRSRDNKIVDCIKHISSDVNSVRILLPGFEYVMPPLSDKIDPFAENNNLENLLNSEITGDNFYSKNFNGVCKQFSKELFSLNNTDKFDTNCLETTKKVFSSINSNNDYYIFTNSNKSVIDFYCYDLKSLMYSNKIAFDNPNDLLDEFYSSKDKQDRLSSKSSDLHKLIKVNMDRCLKKKNILENELKDCEEKDDFRIKGELLTSYIYSLKEGMNEISLLNYYSEEESYLTIKLDPLKNPSENVQAYFKKYNKLKKTEEAAKEQLIINSSELEYLNSVLTSTNNAEEYTDLDEIRNELVVSGYIKFSKNKAKKESKAKPMHFISSDGIDIYVGKNNIQNDYLTLKFADKTDIWLHTKTIPGSHVIIKQSKVPDSTLLEAANLAAYYSKGKDSSKVEVDYTQVRNVKKPSGSKPGMVIYYTNNTIVIDPEEPKLEKAK